ncbi:hypothetical protein SUDANB15_00041 [Streptomyces sp. enrichment culture]
MTAIWAGIDAGKIHHHCVAIDDSGRRLLSRRIATTSPNCSNSSATSWLSATT